MKSQNLQIWLAISEFAFKPFGKLESICQNSGKARHVYDEAYISYTKTSKYF